MKKSSGATAARVRQLVPPLLGWFVREARDLPWRRTLDPYGIWISEIMLQQTQVKTVIPYWERWMRELPDVDALASAPPEKVLKLWEGLGYYTRARNLQKAGILTARQGKGVFPRTYESVLALPGVGRYTAGAICSIAFNHPVPILDGNVIRVLCRLFALEADPRDRKANEHLWNLASALVSEAQALNGQRPLGGTSTPPFRLSGSCSALNQSLMELGALICTPRQPRCSECPVRGQCLALQKNQVETLPNLGKRMKATERRFVAFAVEHRGRWLVRRRPAGTVNAQLWEFPNLELTDGVTDPDSLIARELKFRVSPGQLTALPSIRHSITRFRITLESFRVQLKRRPALLPKDARWASATELEALAFTSAHRKLWRQVNGASRGAAINA